MYDEPLTFDDFAFLEVAISAIRHLFLLQGLPGGFGAEVGGFSHNAPQSLSASASFTLGPLTNGIGTGPDLKMMDRMDRGMDRMDPRMDRMDRGLVGGMGGPMDRAGMGMGMGGMVGAGMDHQRSTSMPGVMGGGPMLHAGPGGRSRSVSRGIPARGGPGGYHSLDRDGFGDREFMPIREPRERSLDRDFGSYGGAAGMGAGMGTAGIGAYGRRERSLDRRDLLDPDDMGGAMYGRDMGLRGGDPLLRGMDPGLGVGGLRGTRLSPNPIGMGVKDPLARDNYLAELNATNSELQRDLGNLKKELELTNQKLSSSMHSIKTFWSPELKKERALRKEESAKYSLINDQLKLLNSENQVSWPVL